MRRAVVPLVLLLAAAAAHAKTSGGGTGLVVRYPSGDAPDLPALRLAMANPAVSTVIFEKGTHLLVDPATNTATTLFVFRHSNLTLCGATGRADDVVIQTAAATTLLVEQSNGTVLRDLTLRSTHALGTALRLNSVVSAEIESFTDDTAIDGCAFEGFVGVQAGVRMRNLTMGRSRCTVTQAGGAGLVWEDGSGLFLTRNRFTTAVAPDSGPTPIAAVFVRGPFVAASEGERARHLLFSRNEVAGDFATGFDLADVTDVRLDRNRITFPAPQYTDVSPDPDETRGRVGIVVRRAQASAQTEDFRLVRNTVHRAHYAAWLLNTGDGVVFANDFTQSGAATVDARFGDVGGALRMNMQNAQCGITIRRNDFRHLRSPAGPSNPAVVIVPAGNEGACFGDDDRNRVDRGRLLYAGAAKR